MKFSSTEEYGLRCLIQLAGNGSDEGMTIPEIAERESLSEHQTAKILRQLRMNGLIESTRGKKGGYSLADAPENISLKRVLNALGGRLYDHEFCLKFTGATETCTHFSDCTVRNLWYSAQILMDTMMDRLTLANIMDYGYLGSFVNSLKHQLSSMEKGA